MSYPSKARAAREEGARRSSIPATAWRRSSASHLPKLARPGHETLEELGDERLGLVVDEGTRGVEPVRRVGNHDFRLVEQMHVQVDAALAQVILGPGCAEHADRRPHDRSWLPVPGAVSVRP